MHVHVQCTVYVYMHVHVYLHCLSAVVFYAILARAVVLHVYLKNPTVYNVHVLHVCD